MIRAILDWLAGWYVTIQIKYQDPRLYEALREEIRIDDFEEANPP